MGIFLLGKGFGVCNGETPGEWDIGVYTWETLGKWDIGVCTRETLVEWDIEVCIGETLGKEDIGIFWVIYKQGGVVCDLFEPSGEFGKEGCCEKENFREISGESPDENGKTCRSWFLDGIFRTQTGKEIGKEEGKSGKGISCGVEEGEADWNLAFFLGIN